MAILLFIRSIVGMGTLSDIWINRVSLLYDDLHMERLFKKRLAEIETRYVQIFIVLILIFNSLYLCIDLLLPSARALISIQFQGLAVIPVYILLFFVFPYAKNKFQYYNGLTAFLFLFTIGSQLLLLMLNQQSGDGMRSIMIVAVVSSYFFSGVHFRQLTLMTPFVIAALILALELHWHHNSMVIIQYLLLYLMTFVGVLLIKYRSEYHHRKDFLKTEIIKADRVKLEHSLDQVHALSDLRKNIISVLAHDVKSPMANLQSLLKLTRDETISIRETKQYLSKVEHQVESVNFVLHDILVWVKSQSEDTDMEWKPFDLSQCFEEMLFIFKDALADKNIQLLSVIEAPEVVCQPEMLKAIIRNLIANAIKFSEEGTSIVLGSEKADNKIKIWVKDHGIGMVPGQLARLQHTFSSSLGTKMEPGTGLGLKICSSLVHSHGSQLEIESESGVGTCISFYLAVSNS